MQFIPWLFLIAQAGIVVASLLGYGIFTSRPDLLVQVDPQARFFTWAFHGFAVGNMLFGGLAVVAESILRNRIRVIVALTAIYVVSLASELLGAADDTFAWELRPDDSWQRRTGGTRSVHRELMERALERASAEERAL